MPRKAKRSYFGTHVDIATANILVRLAQARGITQTELVREALIEYAEKGEKQRDFRRTQEVIFEVRKSTKRLSKVLARAAVDANTIARFIWATADQDGQSLYHQCHNRALELVWKELSPPAQIQVTEQNTDGDKSATDMPE